MHPLVANMLPVSYFRVFRFAIVASSTISDKFDSLT